MNKVSLDIFRGIKNRVEDRFYSYKGRESPRYRYRVIQVRYSPTLCDYEVVIECYKDLDIYDVIAVSAEDFFNEYEEE